MSRTSTIVPSLNSFAHQAPHRHPSSGYLKEKHHINRKRPIRDEYIGPTKFLLGGNITDPLNLASLTDDNNQVTPVSSPIPTPIYNKEVELLIPTDLNDPLRLNKNDDIQESSELCQLLVSPNKIRKRRRKRTDSESILTDLKNELAHQTSDKIVSPVIPQGNVLNHHHRRKVLKEDLSLHLPNASNVNNLKPFLSHSSSTITHNKIDKLNYSKANQFKSSHIQPNQSNNNKFFCANDRKYSKDKKFQYGNYNRYYGYRNVNSVDIRLTKLNKEWFENKIVLDIGCNVGHVTLSIARDFNPKSIVGIDIDSDLIKSAKKNIKNYLSNQYSMEKSDFPISLFLCHGPLIKQDDKILNKMKNSNKSYNEISNEDSDEKKQQNSLSTKTNFPKNINFVAANYVLPSDELLSVQKPEYDCILCLSVTKWIHLNWGDDGIKRTFKRIYMQLFTSGKFILEPQSWWTYKKKKSLTETTSKNYESIKLKPEMFKDYLLSNEVGFTNCEIVEPPSHNIKGFRRPIFIFTK